MPQYQASKRFYKTGSIGFSGLNMSHKVNPEHLNLDQKVFKVDLLWFFMPIVLLQINNLQVVFWFLIYIIIFILYKYIYFTEEIWV